MAKPSNWSGGRVANREKQVLKLVAEGNTNKEIAEFLGIAGDLGEMGTTSAKWRLPVQFGRRRGALDLSKPL